VSTGLCEYTREVEPAERTLIEGKDDELCPRDGDTAEDQIWVVLECDRPLALSSRHSLGGLEAVGIGRDTERRFVRREAEAKASKLGLPDRWMSSRHARLVRQAGGWQLQDAGSTNGTRVNGQSIVQRKLTSGDFIEVGHTLIYFREQVSVGREIPPDVVCSNPRSREPTVLTLSPSLQRCLDELTSVVESGVSILIGGETGTGKEVLARQLARASARTGPLVAVNCAAIPDNLIESELFGSTKGSFSGASGDRVGLIRSADRGWLFLDEIGDLPLPAQAALLRVLQEREVRPVGGARSVPVDFGLISATHQDLHSMVEAGKFRGDLLARIAGYRAELPPLRERREDLGILIGTLLGSLEPERADPRTLAPEAAAALLQYHWPFNVRELRNCLATACSLAQAGPIRREHLPEALRSGDPHSGSVESPVATRELSPGQEQHRAELIELLQEHRGNVSALARATGKARSQYQRWFRRYGLDPERFRS
jgi:DNA-binding NtrC family response regulator